MATERHRPYSGGMTAAQVSEEKVARAAMSLPAHRRSELAVALWQSVHGPAEGEGRGVEVRQETLDMLRERCRQLDAGEVEAVPFDVAIERARARTRVTAGNRR